MSEQPVGAVAASSGASRSDRLDRVISDLLRQTPELEAAAVVSFDGLPMAAALPASMDEDRVAAMSAALLSLGERATQSLGRGDLSQVYIEGETGTVFLISADNEAVLVAVAAAGAKVGMMLFEVRRAAAAVADVLRTEDAEAGYDEQPAGRDEWMPQYSSAPAAPVQPVAPVQAVAPMQAGPLEPAAWTSYSASASVLPGEPPAWS
ncbi:MAG: roadblock/LC7 domain-containing protein [Actinomycetota bacterium]|nr:roadblock/LC7 domain-containing protein [Actinomycetota bacterium]